MNHETAYFTSQTPPETEGRADEYVHVVSHEVHGIHHSRFITPLLHNLHHTITHLDETVIRLGWQYSITQGQNIL